MLSLLVAFPSSAPQTVQVVLHWCRAILLHCLTLLYNPTVSGAYTIHPGVVPGEGQGLWARYAAGTWLCCPRVGSGMGSFSRATLCCAHRSTSSCPSWGPARRSTRPSPASNWRCTLLPPVCPAPQTPASPLALWPAFRVPCAVLCSLVRSNPCLLARGILCLRARSILWPPSQEHAVSLYQGQTQVHEAVGCHEHPPCHKHAFLALEFMLACLLPALPHLAMSPLPRVEASVPVPHCSALSGSETHPCHSPGASRTYLAMWRPLCLCPHSSASSLLTSWCRSTSLLLVSADVMVQKYKPLDVKSDAFRRSAQQVAKLGRRGSRSTFGSQTADYWFEGQCSKVPGPVYTIAGSRGIRCGPQY